jgi:hypothetical protein
MGFPIQGASLIFQTKNVYTQKKTHKILSRVFPQISSFHFRLDPAAISDQIQGLRQLRLYFRLTKMILSLSDIYPFEKAWIMHFKAIK